LPSSFLSIGEEFLQSQEKDLRASVEMPFFAKNFIVEGRIL
jgi:hypothetical protein